MGGWGRGSLPASTPGHPSPPCPLGAALLRQTPRRVAAESSWPVRGSARATRLPSPPCHPSVPIPIAALQPGLMDPIQSSARERELQEVRILPARHRPHPRLAVPKSGDSVPQPRLGGVLPLVCPGWQQRWRQRGSSGPHAPRRGQGSPGQWEGAAGQVGACRRDRGPAGTGCCRRQGKGPPVCQGGRRRGGCGAPPTPAPWVSSPQHPWARGWGGMHGALMPFASVSLCLVSVPPVSILLPSPLGPTVPAPMR